MFKKLLIVSMILIVVFVFLQVNASAKIIVKYGHVGPPIHPQHFGRLHLPSM